MMQPKPFLNNFKTRRVAIGNERRRNNIRLLTSDVANFPLCVEYEDIDKEVNKWLNELEITHEGKRLPVYKLFSNQKIGEYSQSWKHVDEVGNLLLNFLAVTRDNNPKKGNNQGSSFNIPGNRNYPLYIKPILSDDGLEEYELYSMKQPMSIDFSYSITLITNKYQLLNKVNTIIQDKFKAINCYIFPNTYPMPMKLDDVSDESEYTIDDRKYYSQTYKITLMAYIIKKDDYIVTKIPSKLAMRLIGSEVGYITSKKSSIEIEEEEDDNCKVDYNTDRYLAKTIKITMRIPRCEFKIEFENDTNFTVFDIETKHVYPNSIDLYVNNEYVNVYDETSEIVFQKGDIIRIEFDREESKEDTFIILRGETDEVFDSNEFTSNHVIDETLGITHDEITID